MYWASLVAQLVKNPPAMQETLVRFLGQEDPRRRDRLPTPVFLGFPGGWAGKESACNAGDLGSILRLGRSHRREQLPTPVFWPGELHGLYSPWGCKELDVTELDVTFNVLQCLVPISLFSFQVIQVIDRASYNWCWPYDQAEHHKRETPRHCEAQCGTRHCLRAALPWKPAWSLDPIQPLHLTSSLEEIQGDRGMH